MAGKVKVDVVESKCGNPWLFAGKIISVCCAISLFFFIWGDNITRGYVAGHEKECKAKMMNVDISINEIKDDIRIIRDDIKKLLEKQN